MNRTKLLITGSTLVMLFVFLISCDKKVGKLPVAVVTPSVTIGFCDTIKFSKHVKPIILANCATSGCHVANGSGPGDFTTYGELIAKVNAGSFKTKVWATDASVMPPPASGGPLSQAKLDILKCWLDKGALND